MRAHPAGPRHGEILAPAGAPPLPADAEALHALDPHVWPRNAARADGDGLQQRAMRDRRARRPRPRRRVRHPAVRPRRGRLPRRGPRRSARRTPTPTCPPTSSTPARRSSPRASPAGSPRRGSASTSAPAASCSPRCAPGSPASGSPSTATTRASPSSSCALDAGVGRYVVDSFEEIARLADAADARAASWPTSSSASPSASRRTPTSSSPPPTRTRSSASRSPAARPRRPYAASSSCRRCACVGLHSHIGSQIFDTAGFEVSAHRLVGLAAEVRDEHGRRGGRARPRRRHGHRLHRRRRPDDAPRRWPTCCAASSRASARATSLAVPRLAVEPGRAIVGPSMVTLYEVGTVKRVDLGSGHARALRQRRRRHERQHPHRALRRRVHRAARLARLRRRARARPRRRQALRERRHRRARLLAARRPRARRPARRRRDGRLLPRDGLATTTTCRARRSSSVRDGAARVVLRRETADDLLALDAGPDRPWPDRPRTDLRSDRVRGCRARAGHGWRPHIPGRDLDDHARRGARAS